MTPKQQEEKILLILKHLEDVWTCIKTLAQEIKEIIDTGKKIDEIKSRVVEDDPQIYMTVKQVGDSKKYPFTEHAIRALIFDAAYNGFDRCIKRIGKKVLIDCKLFENWIDNPPPRKLKPWQKPKGHKANDIKW